MNTETRSDFSLPEVIASAIDAYKNNKKHFLSISALSALISFITNLLSNAGNYIDLGTSPLLGFLGFIGFLFVFVGLYYTVRFMIAMQVSVLRIIDEQDISIRSSYDSASEYVWKVIGATIIVILILLVPYIIVGIGFIPAIPIYIRAIFGMAGVALVILLGSKFALASVSRVIRPNEKDYLRYSNNLSKSNVMNICLVMALYWIPGLLSFGCIKTIEALQATGMLKFTIERIPMIISIFYQPFQVALLVFTFIGLEKAKGLYTTENSYQNI